MLTANTVNNQGQAVKDLMLRQCHADTTWLENKDLKQKTSETVAMAMNSSVDKAAKFTGWYIQ